MARHVRIPNRRVGQMLDHGSASAYAIHLVAYKLLYDDNWSINEKRVAKRSAKGGIKVGERKLRKGLALVQDLKILEREKGGRQAGGRGAYAKEKLAPDLWNVKRSYVKLPEALVRSEDSKLVAFVAAVLLEPAPEDARKIVKRIGVSSNSPNTINRLVRAAVADQYIAAERVGSDWIVSRPGADLSGFKNAAVEDVAVKNVGIENVATHYNKQEAHSQMKGDHTDPQASPQGTRCYERDHYAPAPDGASASGPEQRSTRQPIVYLSSQIRAAARGRINPDLLTEGGLTELNEIIVLAMARRGLSEDAVRRELIAIIDRRVGAKPKRWLNRWGLIRMPLMQGPRGDDKAVEIDRERAERIVRELIELDKDIILADELLTFSGVAPYLAALDCYGDCARVVVAKVLERGLVGDEQPRRIKSWEYFMKAFEREIFMYNFVRAPGARPYTSEWREGPMDVPF